VAQFSQNWASVTLTQLARAYKAGNISETIEDRAKVTINGLYKVVGLHGLSTAAKIYDLEWPLREIQGRLFLSLILTLTLAGKMAKCSLVRPRRHVEWLDASYLLGTHAYLLTYTLGSGVLGLPGKPAISPKRLKIERKLILTAYIKLNTGFQLPPKCMTLNDLCARFKVTESLYAAQMAKYSLNDSEAM